MEMKGLGEVGRKVLTSATGPSRQESGRVAVRIDARNLPAERDYFTDVTIPRQLWSAWIPSGAEQRKLRRAMGDAERLALERRAAELTPALEPFSRPIEDDRVVDALAQLFDSFRSMRERGENAVARISDAMRTLSDMPAWAIEEGCLSIRRVGYEVREDKQVRMETHWPPSDTEIHAVVANVVRLRKVALASACALLEADIEPAPAPRPTRAEIEAVIGRPLGKYPGDYR